MSKWKQLYLAAIIAVLTTFSLCSQSMAANISVVKGKEGAPDVIIIEGPIVAEDEKTFKQIALNSEYATVVLDSRGGKLRPAIAIGKKIRIKEFSTAVIGADCLSSCALIWLAGHTRHLGRNYRLGFHAAYTEDESGKKTPAATGNALVGSYLNSIGLNESVVAFATKAGANEINWMTKGDADRLGLAVSMLNNKDKRTAIAEFNRALTDRINNKATTSETRKRNRTSADAGFSGAQNNLGDMYELGESVPKNKEFAVYWYTRAAERGEPTAYLSLSSILSEASTDEEVLIEALKYGLLAMYKLPEGLNMLMAEEITRKILAILSPDSIQRAKELARNWDPLYQEKYLMSDTTGNFALTTLPKPQSGNAKAVNVKRIYTQEVSQGYTQALSGEGEWSISEKDTKPIGGKITLNISAAKPHTENGLHFLQVTEAFTLHTTESKTEPIKMNFVSLADPSSFRTLQNSDDDSTTEYQYSIPPKEMMGINERIRVGTLQTRDKSGAVTETGVVFEELRMSLEILGAMEYCLVEHIASTDIQKSEKLSYSCDIFRENEVALGQVAYIVEDNGKTVYKLSLKYSTPKQNNTRAN
jgi:hypothetical protein